MKATKRKLLKTTKGSEAVQKTLFEYQQYYKKAKNVAPEVIRITSAQLERLGVDTGYNFHGSKLELSE